MAEERFQVPEPGLERVDPLPVLLEVPAEVPRQLGERRPVRLGRDGNPALGVGLTKLEQPPRLLEISGPRALPPLPAVGSLLGH